MIECDRHVAACRLADSAFSASDSTVSYAAFAELHMQLNESVLDIEVIVIVQCCPGAVFEQCSEQCSAVFRGTVFQLQDSTGFQS